MTSRAKTCALVRSACCSSVSAIEKLMKLARTGAVADAHPEFATDLARAQLATDLACVARYTRSGQNANVGPPTLRSSSRRWRPASVRALTGDRKSVVARKGAHMG